jgi:uncharacterized membrane protein YcaP (DUF421 family)
MIDELFGDLLHKDDQITDLQMACRAFVVFLLAVALVRLAGRRSFGLRSPFDTVISLLLGATLSRGIVGASSFTGTLVACIILALLHRLCAYWSLRSPTFSRLMSGQKKLLYEDGQFHHRNMNAMLVSEQDLQEAARQEGNEATLDDVKAAFIERNGQISIIKKSPKEELKKELQDNPLTH